MKRKILPIAVMAIATLFLFVWQRTCAQYTKLLDFNGTNGAGPQGSLISDGTYLYGMALGGGVNGGGVIFKIKLDGTGYRDLVDFKGTNGLGPKGSLISDGTYLYGMALGGGAKGYGVVFKVKPDGTGYQDLLDFVGANGSTPDGSLIADGTYLYGMTQGGGTKGYGVVFKVKPDGTGYQDLLDFNGTNGAIPFGSLTNDGTYLYGMTSSGGVNGGGVVFKIKPDGTGYQDLLDFSLANGQLPLGSLISNGTYLYGTTSNGGAYGEGNVFEIKPDGTGYQDLLDFNYIDNANNATSGAFPWGSLVSNGGYLYGMTSGGGANDEGVVFAIKPDGTGYQDLLDFDANNGAGPLGSLISDGTYLYGMTKVGGINNDGVVFKLKLASTLPLNLLSFTGELQHSNALLNWQTTGEINTKNFTIQRSPNGASFAELGGVPATDAPGTNNYSYTDNKPLEGENYYRLKMYDQDGGFTYSGIVKLNYGNMRFGINLYPNPVGSSATLGITTPVQGKYSVAIADATGRGLKHFNGVAVVGSNILQMNVQGLAAGVYIVTYADAIGRHDVKMVKE